MAWKVDPDRSKIEFLVKHLQVTTVRGRFESFGGTLDMNEEDPPASSVEGWVDTASIGTGIGPRDSDLRRPGRFSVKQYPKMTFKSTRVGDFEGDTFKVYGDLTIKDITRPIVIDIVNKGEVPISRDERRWAFGATFEVNRKDFDIQWNVLMDLLVGEEIRGDLDLEFVQE
jgi:polyisoprenoid-binding protein YceI